jgi:hypothetical protein
LEEQLGVPLYEVPVGIIFIWRLDRCAQLFFFPRRGKWKSEGGESRKGRARKRVKTRERRRLLRLRGTTGARNSSSSRVPSSRC